MDFKFIEISIIAGAFFIGLIFGFTSQRSRFCILGSISDYYLFSTIQKSNNDKLSLDDLKNHVRNFFEMHF